MHVIKLNLLMQLHQDYKEKINNLRKLEFNLQEQVRRKEEVYETSGVESSDVGRVGGSDGVMVGGWEDGR